MKMKVEAYMSMYIMRLKWCLWYTVTRPKQYHCSLAANISHHLLRLFWQLAPFPDFPPSLQVLCIHLKRFRFDAYFSSKISRHIAFPLHNLDLGPHLRDCEPPLQLIRE